MFNVRYEEAYTPDGVKIAFFHSITFLTRFPFEVYVYLSVRRATTQNGPKPLRYNVDRFPSVVLIPSGAQAQNSLDGERKVYPVRFSRRDKSCPVQGEGHSLQSKT